MPYLLRSLCFGLLFLSTSFLYGEEGEIVVDDFNRPDSLYHGNAWETLNPGYWKIENHALRRRLENVGDENPQHHFPWHWSDRGRTIEPRPGELAPSLPPGLIWRREWSMVGNYTVKGSFTVHNTSPEGRGEPDGFFGICFGAETLLESYNFPRRRIQSGDGSWMAICNTEGQFYMKEHGRIDETLPEASPNNRIHLEAGSQIEIEVQVSDGEGENACVTTTLRQGEEEWSITINDVDRAKFTEGYFGLVGYGAIDFEVNQVVLEPGENEAVPIQINELHTCYPLGDTLKQVEGAWQCKFVSIVRSDGEQIAIRVADSPNPPGGWEQVPIAGVADIVSNDWRRFTSIVHVTLPDNPAEKTQYYTVWKDGVNVTADPRPAPLEEGYLGPKTYVGRLPQLTAPYRVCTLGGHAIHENSTTLPRNRTFQKNWIHGQPTEGAYEHFEDFNFQIINWDDDVWYLEIVFCPPSTDDAYKIITLTIANPTTRWQMMRHWNVINPGDHDYGMDDVKGPEQILMRQRDNLGHGSAYLRRNFDINHHLVEGRETPVGDTNPEDWRQWKMPNGDFSLIILESRLWRTSQDTNIWVNGGWGHENNLYDRRDPTRTLLGEAQFAWLSETIRTDSAPLICVTGINCMNPVFTGRAIDRTTGYRFAQDDRVAADYAGWVTAGTDRVLEVLGSRTGIISVYGDIHLAGVVENLEQRVIESSCGPIGRGGSRGLKKDWAPLMQDFDGRDVQIHALYHLDYGSPELEPRDDYPMHWNFLEKEFDPRLEDPTTILRIRNINDAPTDPPRGGGIIDRAASTTGRLPSSALPALTTLPHADVYFRTLQGRAICATQSMADGKVQLGSLIDIEPGTEIIMTATSGSEVDAQVITTLDLPSD